MDTKIWKPVVWFEWIYEVNNLWDVVSLNYHREWYSLELKNRLDIDWYLITVLTYNWIYKNKKVHRLVAQAFIENPENKKYVNHINWIKTDNRVDNLEWVTGKENIQHAYRIWLMDNNHFKKNHPVKWKFWIKHYNSKKVNQYSLGWEFIKTWDSLADVQRELWILQASISMCCNWKRNMAGGFIWKFL